MYLCSIVDCRPPFWMCHLWMCCQQCRVRAEPLPLHGYLCSAAVATDWLPLPAVQQLTAPLCGVQCFYGCCCCCLHYPAGRSVTNGLLAVLPLPADPSLPLTVTEWEEWGDPTSDQAAFDNMLSYSPLDNVAAQPYPHLLLTGGG
jgi:hypothetical protein